jgi:1-acyl-sn-glycerol-3-phosphate acyltransferase
MKIVIRFLKFLFTLFAGTFFILTFFIFVPCYFIVFTFFSKEKSPLIAHHISRSWAKTLFVFFLVRAKVKNRELIDERQTYVFIANHQSQLDIPAYAISTKNPLRFLAKIELTKIPLLGYVIRKLYISVDRKDKAARMQSIENMQNSLKEGISVFICPEGTRNRTDKPLLDFHDGAFRLAIETQLPLAVLTVKGADKLLSPLRPLELSPGIIQCTWSKPIVTSGMTMDDLNSLKESARNLMLIALQEN